MRAGTFSILDFNPGASTPSSILPMSSSSTRIGLNQTFVGTKEGKFIPRQLRLNPVRIEKVNAFATALNLTTGSSHPVWGKREWLGEMGAYLFDLCEPVESDFPGNHDVDTGLRDAALQKAYSNIGRADFDTQLFIGELAETIAMLRNPLAAFRKFQRMRDIGHMYDTRTGKVRYVPSKLRNRMDLTADTYLQVIFGIIPLVTEIYNAYKAYKTLTVKSNFLRARGKRKGIVNNYSKSYSRSGILGCTSMAWDLRLETEHSLYARIYFAPTWDAKITEMVRKWGVNPLEVPITAWRVYPLSFVFDWFICVSDWLEAIRPRPEVTILGNCVSEKFTERWNIDLLSMSVHISNAPAQTRLVAVPGSKEPAYTVFRERLIRVVNLPTPIGLHWGNGIDSIGKMVSATMLTWQKLSQTQYRHLANIALRKF